MTYIVKTRGAGGLVVADYRCPEHGVFELTVERDANGDAPDEQPCPCGASSPWTISACKQRIWSVPCYAAVRGGDVKERPPGMLDTRPLAEGQSYSDWRRVQKKARVERRYQQLKDKGMISPKVYSR